MRYLLCLASLFLATSTSLFSQSAQTTVTIVDYKTGKGIPYPTVQALDANKKEIGFKIGDKDGVVSVSSSVAKSIVYLLIAEKSHKSMYVKYTSSVKKITLPIADNMSYGYQNFQKKDSIAWGLLSASIAYKDKNKHKDIEKEIPLGEAISAPASGTYSISPAPASGAAYTTTPSGDSWSASPATVSSTLKKAEGKSKGKSKEIAKPKMVSPSLPIKKASERVADPSMDYSDRSGASVKKAVKRETIKSKAPSPYDVAKGATHTVTTGTKEEKAPAREVGKISYDGEVVTTMITNPVAGDEDKKSTMAPDTRLDESVVDPSAGKAGLLTAAEVYDFNKWKQWQQEVLPTFSAYQSRWKLNTTERYVLQVLNKDNNAVIGASITLLNGTTPIWSAITDNTGKAELFEGYLDSKEKATSIRVNYKNKDYTITTLYPYSKGILNIQLPVDCEVPTLVQVAFVVDATGSMGDEINYLKAEMTNLINGITSIDAKTTVQTQALFYKDNGDDYVVRSSTMTSDLKQTAMYIQNQQAGGGGDFPEAIDEAMASITQSTEWSDEARTKIVFIILDAPPHGNSEQIQRIQKATTEAAKKGIRLVPIVCSGLDKEAEYILRNMALATNGTYITLTDHSGIGGGHITPSTDKVSVSLLTDVVNQVLYRFIYVPACGEKPKDIVKEYFSNVKVIDNVVINPNWIDIKDEVVTIFHTIEDTTKTTTNRRPEDPIPTIKQSLFKYYPNPTDGLLNVEITGEAKTLYLLDINGKLLQEYSFNNSTMMQLNLTNYASGTYLLSAAINDQLISGVVVLQR